MRYSRMRLSHKLVLITLFTGLLVGFTVLRAPTVTDEPAASPADKALEDLSRVEYPSIKAIPWHPHFLLPNQSLESLFGSDWRVAHKTVVAQVVVVVADKDVEHHAGKKLFGVAADQARVGVVAHGHRHHSAHLG